MYKKHLDKPGRETDILFCRSQAGENKVNSDAWQARVCFYRRILLLLILVWFADPIGAAAIKLHVNRDPVSVNESLQLVFESAQQPDQEPDFSPVARDFDILSEQRSSNVSMLNGTVSKQYTWTLTVMPKHAGVLTVPAIRFGSEQSPARDISVQPAQASRSAPAGQALLLTVEAQPEDPYVQQQVIYTVKLYHRVGIVQASLTEPEADNAVIEKLAEDKNYHSRLNGFDYTVTERKYAIFPQQSGTLQIAPLNLTARLVQGGQGRSRFNGFFGTQATYTRRIQSKSIRLQVKSVPDAFKGKYWLPARQIELQEQWSGDVSRMRVGEPLTRTLTLIAKGTTVSQLPAINTRASDQQTALKSYPDQPVLKELKESSGIVAQREQKIAFIATKAGVYRLPAIEIPWWNTQTQQREIVRLAGKTLTVLAPSSKPESVTPAPPDSEQMKTAAASAVFDSSASWMWVAVFLGCGWLLTVLYFLSRRGVAKSADKRPERNRGSDMSQLKQACKNNDALAAKNSLLIWGRQQFGVSSLAALASYCDKTLAEQIRVLNRCLYAPGAGQWNSGKALWQAFRHKRGPGSQQREHDSDVLQPLYKS